MMKFFRIKKSTTFKTHFFSALCRSAFTNTSLIFVSSVFVKSVGGKNYSQLFFFASLASILYYIHFALRGDKEAYVVYKIVIALALIASIFCFLEPRWALLEPYNQASLYFFAVCVIVLDLIGTTLGPVILQLSVNPAIFKEVYQKIVTAELVARIAAAAFIWVLSINHWLVFWYPVGWLTLIIHFFLFNVTVVRLRYAEREAKTRPSEPQSSKDVVKNVGKAVKFIFSNSMVRMAMVIMVWSQVAKFFVEYLFYQAADARFPSARQLAVFISLITMAMIVLSLVLQHLFGKRLTQRLQLSTLFTFQPVNILFLGALALIVPPFWPMVLLLVTFNIINRSIQLPVSRQCLVPIPRKRRATIVSIICVLMSTATMLASGALALVKEALQFNDFLLMLLFFAAGILFLVTGLDSYYIRNLWSFYREARSGRWQEEPVVETLSSIELEAREAVDDPADFKPTADLTAHPILEIYATSFDKSDLKYITRDHKQLLNSKQTDLVLLGLRIAFVTGFPWLVPIMNQALAHQSYEVRKFARLALRVNGEFKNITAYSSVSRRRIKGLALELLEATPQSERIERLKRLLQNADLYAVESLIEVLTDSKFVHLRETLLDCIDANTGQLCLKPIVDRMYECDFQSGKLYREALSNLSFGRNSPEVLSVVESNLSSLNRERLALASQLAATSHDTGEMQRFMHTLFVEEYRLCPFELDHRVTNTIGEFLAISPEDRSILIDMHLEFLKRSQFFRTWRSLMA